MQRQSLFSSRTRACGLTLLFVYVARRARLLAVSGFSLAALALGSLTSAQVGASPGQLTFDPIYVGLTSPTQAVQLTNSGPSTVYLQALVITAGFSITSSNCPLSSAAILVPFAPGANCTLSIEFNPMVSGAQAGSISFSVMDSGFQIIGSAVIALSGTGKFPITAPPLNFGLSVENPSSPATLPLTLTNNGGIALAFSAALANPDYGLDLSQCPQHFFIGPGISCVVNISFAPTITGPDPAALVITAAISDNNHPVGQGSVPLTGTGHPIGVSFIPFGLQLVGGVYQSPVGLFNSSFAPVTVSAVMLSGAGFSKSNDNGCIGTLAPRTFCAINISFAPIANIAYSGTLTIVDGDPTSPQTVAITGTGTALKVSGGASMNFDEQRLLTTSLPQSVMLTNVSKLPVTFRAAADDTAYLVANNCKSKVPAGGSCTVSVTYRPTVNGVDPSKLIITPADPIGPQSFFLGGLGVGIGNMKVRLHYDYMVAADHTHDPEVVAPGAIARIIEAFARHGVELIVDPHHTAIPEIETITFSQGQLCPTSQRNFFTLRDQYFVPKFPDQHYTMFAHSSTDPQVGCLLGAETGQADLPGLNFVVALGFEQSDGFPADVFSMFVSGTTMHELGHNFGLQHGGDEDLNYKPNYLSVMSYAHQFSGIQQAVQVGSTTISACSADADCASGHSCIFHSCRRLDYSGQRLPSGGNTPGALNQSDLDETAGLGSGHGRP